MTMATGGRRQRRWEPKHDIVYKTKGGQLATYTYKVSSISKSSTIPSNAVENNWKFNNALKIVLLSFTTADKVLESLLAAGIERNTMSGIAQFENNKQFVIQFIDSFDSQPLLGRECTIEGKKYKLDE